MVTVNNRNLVPMPGNNVANYPGSQNTAAISGLAGNIESAGAIVQSVDPATGQIINAQR